MTSLTYIKQIYFLEGWDGDGEIGKLYKYEGKNFETSCFIIVSNSLIQVRYNYPVGSRRPTKAQLQYFEYVSKMVY